MAVLNVASDCVADLKNKIETLPGFEKKTFDTYDFLTLIDATQSINFPCVGVAYEGIVTKDPDGQGGGLATYLTCGVFLLVGDKDAEIRGYEKKEDGILLLDQIRNVIKMTKAPTMHRWEFEAEMPFDISKRGLGYYQRWKTTVILT